MTTKANDNPPVTNGEVIIDGKRYMLCGGRDPVPIRKFDSEGNEIEPETAREA